MRTADRPTADKHHPAWMGRSTDLPRANIHQGLSRVLGLMNVCKHDCLPRQRPRQPASGETQIMSCRQTLKKTCTHGEREGAFNTATACSPDDGGIPTHKGQIQAQSNMAEENTGPLVMSGLANMSVPSHCSLYLKSTCPHSTQDTPIFHIHVSYSAFLCIVMEWNKHTLN